VRVDVSSAGNLKEAAGATVDIVAGPHGGSPNTPQGQAPVGEALRAQLLGLSPAEAVSAAIELLDGEADVGASKAVAAGVRERPSVPGRGNLWNASSPRPRCIRTLRRFWTIWRWVAPRTATKRTEKMSRS
jgi:hypothetical protein